MRFALVMCDYGLPFLAVAYLQDMSHTPKICVLPVCLSHWCAVLKGYQYVDDTEANHLKEQEVGMKTLLKFK
jgi:hypothetical protein